MPDKARHAANGAAQAVDCVEIPSAPEARRVAGTGLFMLLAGGLLAIMPQAPAFGLARPPSADAVAHAYVQGRLALSEDELAVAAERFGVALKTSPDDLLRRRALDVAILSGDMKAAVRLAGQVRLDHERPGFALADSLVGLIRLSGAAAARDWRAYEAERLALAESGRTDGANPLMGAVLEAYGLSARGQHDAALALVDPAKAGGIAASYFAEHRAHLLALAGRWPEAAEAYSGLVAAEGANVARLRLNAVSTALKAARTEPEWRDRAILALGSGPQRDPVLMAARAAFARNPRLSPEALGGILARQQDGLALMFMRVAGDLMRERATGPALGFARIATLLAPDLPEAWLVTADVLARNSKPDLALEALSRLDRAGAWADVTPGRRAAYLSAAGRQDEARAIVARVVAGPDAQLEDWARHADIERQAGNHRQSAEAYARAIARAGEEALGPVQMAQLHFLHGSALEQAGDWAAAEGELRRAVTLQPENPVYLNYLGYSLLDRSLAMAEARDLIARAFKAAPENGAIIDSMGWAEYRAGNHAEAVRLLEKARAAEPGDPTVADHLGDALWRMGRRIEARHAWRAAQALQPDEALSAALALKLDYGLDIALAGKP